MGRKKNKKHRILRKVISLLVILLILFVLMCFLTKDMEGNVESTPGDWAVAGLELPAPIDGEEIIKHTGYTLSYNEEHELPSYVAYELTREEVLGNTARDDNFREDILPKIQRIEQPEQATGGYVFTGENGYVAMEAEHFFAQTGAAGAAWTKIPYVGRTLSGMALMPYTAATDGASLSYRMQIPADVKEVTVHVIVKSTLAFHNPEGHRYGIGFKGGEETVINFNGNLNEKPENVYSVYYPTVARRVIEKKVDLTLPAAEGGMQTLVFRPIEPGTVLEKIVVDYGGYKPSYLFMEESPCKKQ